MNRIAVNALRFVICGIGLALVFRWAYENPPNYTAREQVKYYAVTCAVFSAMGLVAWFLRIRSSRLAGAVSSAVIAAGICFAFVWVTGSSDFDGPWDYFYRDDDIYLFMYLAPFALAILTALLSLIPEQPRKPVPIEIPE